MNDQEENQQEASEIVQLYQENNQLKSDIKNMQKQFNDAINAYPKAEELIKENVALKKKLNESTLLADDLTNRLTISIQSQKDFKAKYENDQNNNAKKLNSQINQLKGKISDLESNQKKQNEEDEKRFKIAEEGLLQKEKQNKLYKNQLSKVLTLSSNFFKLQFENIDSLLSFLVQCPNIQTPEKSEKQQNDVQSQSTNLETQASQMKKYQEKYKKEKARNSKLEHSLKEMKKNTEQQIRDHQNALDNLHKKHRDEISEIDMKHQTEIQKWKNEADQSQKKFQRINTQLNQTLQQLEIANQNRFEQDSNDSDNESNNNDCDSDVNNKSYNLVNQMNLQLKEQVDNLVEQLRVSEEKILDLREKQKDKITKIEQLQKNLKSAKKRNTELQQELLTFKNKEQERVHVDKEKQFAHKVSLESNSTKNSSNDNEPLQKAVDLMTTFVDNRETDIQKLTDTRDKLLSLIHLQNQYIENTEGLIARLIQKKESQEKIIKNFTMGSNENDHASSGNNLLKNIDWQFDQFPQSVVPLLRPIAENDCLPINLRIRHVMLIIAKWATSLDNKLQSEIDLTRDRNEQLSKKYENFVSEILSAFGEKKDLAENEIIGKINELSSSNFNLQQKLNDAEKAIKENGNQKIKSDDNINQNLIETKKCLKRKKSQLRECKLAIRECQEQFSRDIDILKQDNCKLKTENEDLHHQIYAIKRENDEVTTRMEQMKKNFEDEMDDAQNEIQKLQLINSNQIAEIQKESRKHLKNKEKQIHDLKSQLDDATKTIENYEESTRASIEDINHTKHQLDECKLKNKETVSKIIKQKEKEKAEMEKYYLTQIENLEKKINELTQHYPNEQSIQKIQEAEKMIEELESQVIQLTYQIQQESLRNKTEINTMDRNNKLIAVQNKAKLMAAEATFSIKCDELKKQFEDEKKHFLSYIVQNFPTYFDLRKELDEAAAKEAIEKIKAQLNASQKRDQSIRELVSAREGQSTEEALTDLIISMNNQI